MAAVINSSVNSSPPDAALPSQIPVLEVDGVQMAQSQAIEFYCAGLANLLPSDPLLAAKCIEINQSFSVSVNAASQVHTAVG